MTGSFQLVVALAITLRPYLFLVGAYVDERRPTRRPSDVHIHTH